MRPVSEWADMRELSYNFTKKGTEKVSSVEAKEVGVGNFLAR